MLNQNYKHSQSLKMVFVNEINSETDGEKNKGELSWEGDELMSILLFYYQAMYLK